MASDIKPFDHMHLSLRTYLDNSLFADLIVECDDKRFDCHKIIFATHSNYFLKLLSGEWKESQEGKITLQGDDVSVVEAMIQFMYNLDYSVIESDCPLLFNAKVYGIADKYDVPGLKVVAKGKVADKISRHKFDFDFFFEDKDTTKEIDNFSKAIIEVYDSTPSTDRGLRDILVMESCNRVQRFLGNDSFQKAMADCHGFCLDLATYMGKRQGVRNH